MDLNKETYAYIAGLIDGDGSITIVNRNYKYKENKGKSYRIKICIYNCNTKLATNLKETFGGKTRSNHINKKHPKWRNCQEYSIQDNKAIDLIINIQPFLIVKGEQAHLALEAADIKNKYSAVAKRWQPQLKIECDEKLSQLKEQINLLNVRGSGKIVKPIDVGNIPFNIHYLSGFCDADGSIFISKMTKEVVAKITFANTNKNIIDWIELHKGGNLEIKISEKEEWNTSYSLCFPQTNAYQLAGELHPFLLLKKRQAKLLLTLGKIKSLYNAATLRWNPELNLRCKRLQNKLRDMCAFLNKKSV